MSTLSALLNQATVIVPSKLFVSVISSVVPRAELLRCCQATFQRNASGDPAAEEEFEKFCADAMFTIGILEQRLVAHEESALKKYHALDERISSDPRMAALHM